MAREYWITNSRFKYIALLLITIWIGFMVLVYLKADEITKDPCAICSEIMGKNVFCTTQSAIPVTRIYLPNGTVLDNAEEMKKDFIEKEYKNKSEGINNINYSSLIPDD